MILENIQSRVQKLYFYIYHLSLSEYTRTEIYVYGR